MRRLNVCVLGPAALIITAVAIALTPMTSNAATTANDTAAAAHDRQATVGSMQMERNAILAAGESTCTVTDAAITWGVKESLRSYISGTIANGEWAVSDGATYDTPYFGWAGGSGELERGTGTLKFDGSLRFTGHDGILDTTLTGLRIELDGTTTAHLFFDVFGTTQDGLPVNERSVDFATIDTSGLKVVDGTAELLAAEVVLTEEGATAFGTYPAGENFDPLAITFAANDECLPQPTDHAAVVHRNLVIAIAVVAVAVCAGIVFLVARRRGTSRTSLTAPPGTPTETPEP